MLVEPQSPHSHYKGPIEKEAVEECSVVWVYCRPQEVRKAGDARARTGEEERRAPIGFDAEESAREVVAESAGDGAADDVCWPVHKGLP